MLWRCGRWEYHYNITTLNVPTTIYSLEWPFGDKRTSQWLFDRNILLFIVLLLQIGRDTYIYIHISTLLSLFSVSKATIESLMSYWEVKLRMCLFSTKHLARAAWFRDYFVPARRVLILEIYQLFYLRAIMPISNRAYQLFATPKPYFVFKINGKTPFHLKFWRNIILWFDIGWHSWLCPDHDTCSDPHQSDCKW